MGNWIRSRLNRLGYIFFRESGGASRLTRLAVAGTGCDTTMQERRLVATSPAERVALSGDIPADD